MAPPKICSNSKVDWFQRGSDNLSTCATVDYSHARIWEPLVSFPHRNHRVHYEDGVSVFIMHLTNTEIRRVISFLLLFRSSSRILSWAVIMYKLFQSSAAAASSSDYFLQRGRFGWSSFPSNSWESASLCHVEIYKLNGVFGVLIDSEELSYCTWVFPR
jgi:hypothetical protein